MDGTHSTAGAAAVHTALAAIVTDGAAAYRRAAILPRLLPVGPGDLAPDTVPVARRLCRMLARALRQERARGRAGHWSYNLDRHIGLLQAFRAERAHLAALEPASRQGAAP